MSGGHEANRPPPSLDSFFQSLNRNIIFSNLLDFFRHDHRVGLLDLLGAQLLVVEVAFVLITVSVYAAEQAAATAGETWKKNGRRQKCNIKRIQNKL